MDKDSLVNDMEVRFAPDDREQYGDGWHTYSELAMISMRGRELMTLEATFGVPVASLMDAFRADATYANMAMAWIAAGRPGDWKDFNPLILQAEWRVKETEEEMGKSLAPGSEPGETPTAPEVFAALPTTPAPASTS